MKPTSLVIEGVDFLEPVQLLADNLIAAGADVAVEPAGAGWVEHVIAYVMDIDWRSVESSLATNLLANGIRHTWCSAECVAGNEDCRHGDGGRHTANHRDNLGCFRAAA